MSLPEGKFNRLNLLGFRKLFFIPEHFQFVELPSTIKVDLVDAWIYENLDGRYSLLKQVDNKYIVGFENPTDVTMFCLSCPYIKS